MKSMNFYEVKKRTEELALMRKRFFISCLKMLLVIFGFTLLYWGFLIWY